MNKIRVLIVDDAVVVRLLVTKVLSGDPSIEVIGTAANGRIALSKIAQLKPDIITMDVEMPELNGLETLAQLRKLYPRFRADLIPKIKHWSGFAPASHEPLPPSTLTAPSPEASQAPLPLSKRLQQRREGAASLQAASAAEAKNSKPSVYPKLKPGQRPPRDNQLRRVDLVAIGVSTGGPNALSDLLSLLPAQLPVPIVIVQHMPATFTRLLAERLDTRCAITVREAQEGVIPTPGEAWIAPGDFHMRVVRSGGGFELKLSKEAPENFCRPAVDVLFRSVASTCGANTLALVLTGMGHDGYAGSESIYAAGGRIMAQDEASSVVWGMPSFIVRGGLSDATLPLDGLAQEIIRRVNIERHRPQMV
jgi:two-component system chemotaxis response regulator CheB